MPLAALSLPAGYAVALWARVPGARQMTLSPGGVVYVGSRQGGAVTAIPFDETLQAGTPRIVARHLDDPTGVAWHRGSLYVGAMHRLLRLDDIDRRLDAPPAPVVIRDDLPRDRHHGWKFIAFGPDGRLYVPVGAPCNLCEPEPDNYAVILRFSPDGRTREVFARGVRNTVGFDWHPDSHELWFTDNGRDWLGDDAPADELNRAAQAGLDFGYPHCLDRRTRDPAYAGAHDCTVREPPAQPLGAHVAPLGMRFYTGRQFPVPRAGDRQIFIAEHGSWNRKAKVGYRVSRVILDGDRPVAYRPFVSGWLQGETAWGRPADVLVMPDGSLLISDDLAGAIYRVTYRPPGEANPGRAP